MTKPIIVRKYREGDEEDNLELGRICFFRTDFDYWMKHWIWEYKENPFGNHIWVVEHDGNIVAHYTIIPLNVKIGESVLKCGIGADTMTHPNYRRRGLYNKIQEKSRKAMRARTHTKKNLDLEKNRTRVKKTLFNRVFSPHLVDPLG